MRAIDLYDDFASIWYVRNFSWKVFIAKLGHFEVEYLLWAHCPYTLTFTTLESHIFKMTQLCNEKLSGKFSHIPYRRKIIVQIDFGCTSAWSSHELCEAAHMTLSCLCPRLVPPSFDDDQPVDPTISCWLQRQDVLDIPPLLQPYG